jgi:hypothetical protein
VTPIKESENIPIISEDFIGLNSKNWMRTTITAFADFFPKRLKNKKEMMTIITAFAEFILKRLDNKKEIKTMPAVFAEYIPHLVMKDENILILVVKEVDWVQILSNSIEIHLKGFHKVGREEVQELLVGIKESEKTEEVVREGREV